MTVELICSHCHLSNIPYTLVCSLVPCSVASQQEDLGFDSRLGHRSVLRSAIPESLLGIPVLAWVSSPNDPNIGIYRTDSSAFHAPGQDMRWAIGHVTLMWLTPAPYCPRWKDSRMRNGRELVSEAGTPSVCLCTMCCHSLHPCVLCW